MFKNPAERVTSILNFSLQSIGIARSKMIDSNEEAIKSCNSVGEIRRVAAQNSLCEELLDSIEPVKVTEKNH